MLTHIKSDTQCRLLGHRSFSVATLALGMLILGGCGESQEAVELEECYLLDFVVFNEGLERVNLVTLGVRTTPEPHQLTPADYELVARNGNKYPLEREAQEIGRHSWFLFHVPMELANSGELSFRTKASGKEIPLPKEIEKKAVDDLLEE